MERSDVLRRTGQAYAAQAPDERPLRGYAAAMATFAAAAATVGAAARLTGRRLPERPPAADLVLLAVATHKLSRLLTKESVTSPLRAPVTQFAGAAGAAELTERPRGTGLRHALGELATCPFCAAVWVAGGLASALVFAPRPTRFAMGVASAVAGADFLHLGYDAAKHAASR